MNEFERVRTYLTDLQDRICAAIEAVDGQARFQEDLWQRAEGGGGRTRVLRDGAVFEQAGIGFSDVAGSRLPPSASANRPELAGASWRATGVSLVFHPLNPYVPTTHANVRFFQAQRDGEVVASWFGGGFDTSTQLAVPADADPSCIAEVQRIHQATRGAEGAAGQRRSRRRPQRGAQRLQCRQALAGGAFLTGRARCGQCLHRLQGVAGFPRELGHAAAEAAMADLLAQLQQLLALRGRHHHRRGG